MSVSPVAISSNHPLHHLSSNSPKRRAKGGPEGADRGETFQGLLKNVKPF